MAENILWQTEIALKSEEMNPFINSQKLMTLSDENGGKKKKGCLPWRIHVDESIVFGSFTVGIGKTNTHTHRINVACGTMEAATIGHNTCVNILLKVLLKSFRSVWQGQCEAPAISKGSFNSSLKREKTNVWCEKTPRQSKPAQNSRLTFKPVSCVKAKPQTALLLWSHPLLQPVTPLS